MNKKTEYVSPELEFMDVVFFDTNNSGGAEDELPYQPFSF